MSLTPTFLRNATACPSVQVPAVPPSPFDATVQPLVSRGIAVGTSAPAASSLTTNAKLTDAGAAFGAGFYGVASGLGITAVSGLTVQVGLGYALCGGTVQLLANTNVVLTDSTDNYLWLSQGKSIVVQTSTASPSGSNVFLGVVTCSGGSATALDLSGVVYAFSGMPWRTTHDTTTPGDSPSTSVRIWTQTQGGVYLWTGLAHTKLGT